MASPTYRDALEDVLLAALIFALSFPAFPPEQRGCGMHTLGMVLVGFNLGSAYVKAVALFRKRVEDKYGEMEDD